MDTKGTRDIKLASERQNLPIYYIFVVIVALAIFYSMVVPSPNAKFTLDAWAKVSFLIELAAVLMTFLSLDQVIRSRLSRGVLAGFGFLLTLGLLLDSYLLSRTHYTGFGLAQITLLGGDLSGTLDEVNLPIGKLAALFCFPVFVLLLGAWVYRLTEKWQLSGKIFRFVPLLALFLWVVFIGEQIGSRGSDYYGLRGSNLPDYLKLIPASVDTYRVPRTTRSIVTNDAELKRVQSLAAAKNPKNVLFVLLESVRGDYITSENSPTLESIRKEGINFPQAHPEAISTVLVWHTLFMSQPPYNLERDISVEDQVHSFAPMIQILKSAGYDLFLSVANNPSMKGESRRLVGENPSPDLFYSGFDGTYTARHLSDRRVGESATRWLESKRDPKKPFFMLVQFDGTHWPYQFSDEDAQFKPYAAADPVDELTEEGMSRVQNRYRNAVHGVDRNIGKIVADLKRLGLDQDTAIIVVSDHGEGFQVGNLAHLSLLPGTRSIPYFLKLPGVGAQEKQVRVTHRNLFPTLFEYLGIALPKNDFLMPSALSDSSAGSLTYNGSLNQATIDFGDVTVWFDTALSENDISFTPTAVTSPDGKVLSAWKEKLSQLPWKEVIKKVVE